MTDLEASVAEAAAILEELAIPYMLIGGLAVAAWGEARATLDVDLSVWVEPQRFDDAVARLCSRLKPLTADPLRFAKHIRVLPASSSRGIKLDIVFASLPAERDMIARSRPIELGGRPVNVATVEDLIWMKLISEQPKDQVPAGSSAAFVTRSTALTWSPDCKSCPKPSPARTYSISSGVK